jgi:hypothetical protein
MAEAAKEAGEEGGHLLALPLLLTGALANFVFDRCAHEVGAIFEFFQQFSDPRECAVLECDSAAFGEFLLSAHRVWVFDGNRLLLHVVCHT